MSDMRVPRMGADEVFAILSRTRDIDPDHRFMALSDLNKLMDHQSKQFFTYPRVVSKVLESLFQGLVDLNSEVQNQAITCFRPLVKIITVDTLCEVIMRLIRLSTDSSVGISIPITAARTALLNFTVTISNAKKISSSLLPLLLANGLSSSLDKMELLSDVIKRLGSTFTITQITKTTSILINISFTEEGIISKRAISALGSLVRYTSPSLTKDIIELINAEYDKTIKADNDKRTKIKTSITRISLFSSICKVDHLKLVDLVSIVAPIVFENLYIDKLGGDMDENIELDDVRDEAFTALEHLAYLGTDALGDYFDKFIESIISFLDYDPNRVLDDEDVDDDGETNNPNAYGDEYDDDYDFTDEENFDDDDSSDLSWRLRKHAAKLSLILVKTNPTMLPSIYTKVFERLFSRTVERIEAVKLEVISSLSGIIEATSTEGEYHSSKLYASERRRSSDTSMTSVEEPIIQLTYFMKPLGAAIVADLSKTNLQTVIRAYIFLLINLSHVLGGIDELFPTLFPVIHSVAKSSYGLTSDIFKLYSEILKTVVDNKAIKQFLPLVTEDIVSGIIGASTHGAILDAIDTSVFLGNVLVSFSGKFVKTLALETALIKKIVDTATDSEAKAKAIHSLANLISKNIIVEKELKDALEIISSCLPREITRYPSILAVTVITSQDSVIKKFPIQWLKTVINGLESFLNLGNKQIRLRTYKALKNISFHLNNQKSDIIVELINQIITYLPIDDEKILSESINVLSIVYPLASSNKNVTENLIHNVIKKLTQQSIEPSSLQPLITLAGCISLNYSAENFYHIIDSSYREASYPLVAKVLAAIVVSGNLEHYITQFKKDLETDRGNILSTLLLVGNIGRLKPNLDIPLDLIFKHFESENESIRLAAAITLGNIISNNVSMHLQDLISRLKQDKKNRYLLLIALKQEISIKLEHIDDYKLANETLNIDETRTATILWDALFSAQEESTEIDDNEAAAYAECIGRLTVLHPETFLNDLKNRLNTNNISVRKSIIAAIKFTLTYSDSNQYDNLLKPVLSDFLSLVQDSDMGIRQLSLGALISAIHNKPYLLLSLLPSLLPLVYKELPKRQEFVRVIQMGPFKHDIDDGLELRKTAFETLYTLVTALSPEQIRYVINIRDLFFKVATLGLSDDHEILILSTVIIGRLAYLDVKILETNMDDEVAPLNLLIEKFNAVLNKKLKETAIKQEIEKQSELIRNVIRSINQITSYIHGEGLNTDSVLSISSTLGIRNTQTLSKKFNNVNININLNDVSSDSLTDSLGASELSAVDTATWDSYFGEVFKKFSSTFKKLDD